MLAIRSPKTQEIKKYSFEHCLLVIKIECYQT